jgi:SAM-dependent methyltransferase
MRGWLPFYVTSWRLGVRALRERRELREAVIRLVIPLDPSRYLEFPDTLRELEPHPGDRILDLASPKLMAVELARRGAEVTSVDAYAPEISRWRALTEGQRGLRFAIADGRALPFADACFHCAYAISVLEHVPAEGDLQALRELARVVKPGGRVVITVPYADRYREDWRDEPMYGLQEPVNGRYFFERWYDDARLGELAGAAPGLRLVGSRISRMAPNWHLLYLRTFPWLLPLGPFFGVLARERVGPPGDVARLTLERTTT